MLYLWSRKNAVVVVVVFVVVLIVITYRKREEFPVEGHTSSLSFVYAPGSVGVEKLFDLDFKYVTNSDECGSEIWAVILVTSYFGNVETRSAMRRSFSSRELEAFGLKRVFLLGLARNDKFTRQEAIADESRRFGDLIQGNFYEAYRNLTYKHLMGLKWAVNACPRAKYIVKMDDDIVIDVLKIAALLKAAKRNYPKRLLAGYVLRNLPAIRLKANKWYVKEDEYKFDTYPAFLSGWFYVTNPKTGFELIAASESTPYLWIDDLYITGLLAREIRAKHVDLCDIFTVHPEFLDCCMRDVDKYGFDCEFLVGPNGGDPNLFFAFNAKMGRCSHRKCAKRKRFLNETCVAERKLPFLGRGDADVKPYNLV